MAGHTNYVCLSLDDSIMMDVGDQRDNEIVRSNFSFESSLVAYVDRNSTSVS